MCMTFLIWPSTNCGSARAENKTIVRFVEDCTTEDGLTEPRRVLLLITFDDDDVLLAFSTNISAASVRKLASDRALY